MTKNKNNPPEIFWEMLGIALILAAYLGGTALIVQVTSK